MITTPTTCVDVDIDEDIIVAAPLLHDWGKPIVFQWNADGTEFAELNFGGNGATDNYGAAGDSRTGAHHIIGVAESMARGLPPKFVITQASAHSSPTSGNEYKVVNWLRAAAIIAGIDPVAKGYLRVDGAGHLRLPAVQRLGDVDLNAATPTQVNAPGRVPAAQPVGRRLHADRPGGLGRADPARDSWRRRSASTRPTPPATTTTTATRRSRTSPPSGSTCSTPRAA